MPAITSLKATKVNELTAVFASAVKEDVDVVVKKGTTVTGISGTTAWSDDKTTLTFTAAANFTAGKYTMTVTSKADSALSVSAECTVENEKVDLIEIKNETALLKVGDKKTAYAYYDVYNQYGESIRNSTTISWTPSNGSITVDKTIGRLKVTRVDQEWTYGTSLFITGVHNKSGKSAQKELKIGMEQSVDEIAIAGFIKMSDKSKILKELPTNFQKNEYVLAFQAMDQNGNPIPTSDIADITKKLTIISDNPLLIKSEFNADKIYTVAGEEYFSVTVEPGQYVDKGGEVNISAISSGTGKKTTKNFVIGTAALIYSIELFQPSTVVSDGEMNVEIPYVAKDKAGNTYTNYEVIVRSTNTLNLNASDSTSLVIREANDGTAKVLWTDKVMSYADSETYNDVDRTVALTTVVVGGESNTLLLQVSDMARPVAVSKARLDYQNISTAVVERNNSALKLTSFTFVDQYGREMNDKIEVNYVGRATGTGLSYHHEISYAPHKYNPEHWTPHFCMADLAQTFMNLSSFDNTYYAVKVEPNQAGSFFKFGAASATTTLIGASGSSYDVPTVTWSVDEGTVTKAELESFKYTVVALDKDITTDAADHFDNCSKSLTVDYTVLPMSKVTNIAVKGQNKKRFDLTVGGKNLSTYATGRAAGLEDTDLVKTLTAASATATMDTVYGWKNDMGVSGQYKGVPVSIPGAYVAYTSDTFTFSGITIDGIKQGAVKLGDFYDAKSANFERKDGQGVVKAFVYKALTQTPQYMIANPTTTIKFSDEGRRPATVNFNTRVANPTLTVISNTFFNYTVKRDGTAYVDGDLPNYQHKDCGCFDIIDQYGDTLSRTANDFAMKISISDVVENAGEFAHLDNSFEVDSNASTAISVTGAELGDKFKVTFDVSNKYGEVSSSFDITVGADTEAYIVPGTDNDKTLRTVLKYAY